MKHVLTIAGSDSGGGAGIQADIKTMCALGVYAMSVITAVTAQNTVAVEEVQEITPDMVQAQIRMIYEDIRVDAVKIGMVSSKDNIEAIACSLSKYCAKQVVLDPVMVSKSGYRLLQPEAEEAMSALIEIADLITPNIPEAEVLAGMPVRNLEEMKAAAETISGRGIKHVLVKGGHGYGAEAIDVLFSQGEVTTYTRTRSLVDGIHGTGCTLSSAVACFLAKGHNVASAVAEAKAYITAGIEHPQYVGKGHGTVGHLWALYEKAGWEAE